jgi:hypothetical protein
MQTYNDHLQDARGPQAGNAGLLEIRLSCQLFIVRLSKNLRDFP